MTKTEAKKLILDLQRNLNIIDAELNGKRPNKQIRQEIEELENHIIDLQETYKL
jgi:archaellum component FlaC